MYETLISMIWPGAGFFVWFAGATVLQVRARAQPDWRLIATLITMTVVTFHFDAYFNIAANQDAFRSALIPFFDITIMVLGLVVVKRRVREESRFFLMFSLLLCGALLFWSWYITKLGGLTPS